MKTQSVDPMFRQKRIHHTQGKRGRKGKIAWWNLEMFQFMQFQSLNLCLGFFTFATWGSCERVLQRERGWHCKVCMKRESRQNTYFKLQVLVSLDECFSRLLLSLSLLFKLDHVLNSKINDKALHTKLVKVLLSNSKLKTQHFFCFSLQVITITTNTNYQFLFLFFFLSPFSLSLSLSSP